MWNMESYFLFTYSPKIDLIFFGNELFNNQKKELKNEAEYN